MFRNIIWDVDGTLFDTYPAMARAIKAALNDLGRDASLAWITEIARQSLSECDVVLADRYQLDRVDLEQALEKHFNLITGEESPPFPGVVDLCKYIYSINGKNVIVTHRGRMGTMDLLTAHKLAGYFVGCITRDDGYPRKPHPAAFEAALGIHQLQREETLTVGDRRIDILAGQAAGLFSCYYGIDIDGVKADLTVSSFNQLHEYLLKTR